MRARLIRAPVDASSTAAADRAVTPTCEVCERFASAICREACCRAALEKRRCPPPVRIEGGMRPPRSHALMVWVLTPSCRASSLILNNRSVVILSSYRKNPVWPVTLD